MTVVIILSVFLQMAIMHNSACFVMEVPVESSLVL